MSDSVTTELIIDARGAVEGTAQYEAALIVAQRAVDKFTERQEKLAAQAAATAKALADGTQTISASAASISSADRALASYLGRLDPVFFAQKQLTDESNKIAAAMNTLDRQLSAGLGPAQYAEKMGMLRVRLAEVKDSISGLAAGTLTIDQALATMKTQAEQTAAAMANLGKGTLTAAEQAAEASAAYTEFIEGLASRYVPGLNAAEAAMRRFAQASEDLGVLRMTGALSDQEAREALDREADAYNRATAAAEQNRLTLIRRAESNRLSALGLQQDPGPFTPPPGLPTPNTGSQRQADLDAAFGTGIDAVVSKYSALTAATNAQNAAQAGLNTAQATGDLTAQEYAAAQAVLAKAVTDAANADANAAKATQDAADRRRAAIDPLFRVSKEYSDQVDKINAEFLSTNPQKAAVLIDNLTQSYAQNQKALQGTQYALAGHTASTFQAAFAQRQFAVQMVQLGYSLDAGIPPMLAIVQQGHQIIDVAFATGTGFDEIAAGIKRMASAAAVWVGNNSMLVSLTALVAILATVTYSAETANQAQKNLQNELAATRDDAVSASKTVEDATRILTTTTPLGFAAAQAGASQVEKSSSFQGNSNQLAGIVTLGLQLQKTIGGDLTSSLKLLVTGFDDAGKAAQSLLDRDNGFKGLDQTIVDTIKNIQATDGPVQAWAALRTIIENTTKGSIDNVTALQAAWQRFTELLSSSGHGTWHDVGTQIAEGLAEGLQVINNLIEAYQKLQSLTPSILPTGPGFGTVGEDLKNLNKALGIIVDRLNKAGGDPTLNAGNQLADLLRQRTDAEAQLQSLTSSGPASNVGEARDTLIRQQTDRLDKLNEAIEKLTNTLVEKSVTGGDGSGGTTGTNNLFGLRNPGQSTGFRNFNSPEESVAAAIKQLQTNADTHGLSTIQQQIAGNGQGPWGWATTGAGNSQASVDNYIAAIVKATGIQPGAPLNVRDADVVRKVVTAMAQVETGKKIDQAVIDRGVDIAMRQNGAGGVVTNPGLTLSRAEGDIASVPQRQRELNIEQQNIQLRGIQTETNKIMSGGLTGGDLDTALTKVAEFRDRLVQLRGAYADILDPQEKMSRAAKDSVVPLSAEAGAARNLAAAANEFRIAERSAGKEGFEDLATKADVLSAAQLKLTTQFEDGVKAVVRNTEAQNQLVPALVAGGEAASHAQNFFKALEDVRATATPGTAEYRRQVVELTAALDAQTLSKRNDTAAVDINKLSNEADLIKLQTSLIGESVTVRTRELAVLQERQKLGLQPGQVATETEQAAIIANAQVAQLKQVQQQAQQSADALLGSFGNAIDRLGQGLVDAFLSGKDAAVNFGSIAKSVLASLLSDLFKFAVVNPLRNLFGGTQQPTLGAGLGALFGGGSNSQQSATDNNVAQLTSIVLANASSGGNATGQGSANLQFIDPGNPALGFTSVGSGGGGVIGGNLGGGGLGAADVLSILRAGASLGGQGQTSSGGGFLGTASNLFSIAGTAQKLGLFGSTSSGGGGILDFFGLGNIGKQFSGLTNNLGLTGQGGIVSRLGGGISSFFNTPLTSSFGGSVFAGLPSSFSQLGVSAGEQAFLGAAGINAPTSGGLAAAGGAVSTIGDFVGGVGAGFTVGSLVGGLVQRGANKVGPGPQIGAGVGAVGGAIAGTLIFPGIGTIIGAIIGGLIGGSGGGLIGPRPPSPYSQTLIGLRPGGTGLESGITNSQLVDGAGESAQARKDIKQINAALSAAGGAFDLSGPLLSASGDFGGARSRDTINSFVGVPANNKGAMNTLKSWGLSPDDIAWLQVGQNSPKGSKDPSKIQDLNTDFWKFAFKSAEPMMNAFFQGTGSVDPVRGTGRGFVSIDEFQNQTKVVKGFIDAISGTDFAPRVPDLFRNKLPQGGTAQDYQTTLQPIVTLVTQTIPQLLRVGSPAGSLADTIQGLNDQFKDAIKQAGDLGYKEQELTATRDRAIAMAQKAADQASRRQDQQLSERYQAASSQLDPKNTGLARAAGLQVIDDKAQAEREDFAKSLIDTYGDAYASTQAYADKITALEKTLQQERLVGIKALDDAAKAQTASARSAALSFVTSLKSFIVGLQTGSASPASPASQLQIAQQSFSEMSIKARGGDATALSGIQNSASTLLNVAKAYYGSSAGYTAVFNEVTSGLKGIAEMSSDALTQAFFAAETEDQTTALDKALEAVRKEIIKLENITSGTSADPAVLEQIANANAAAINSVAAQTAKAAIETSGSVTDLVSFTHALVDTLAYTNTLLVSWFSWGFGIVNQAVVNAMNSNWAGQQWVVKQLNALQSWDDSLIIQAIRGVSINVSGGGAVGGGGADLGTNGTEGGQQAGGWLASGGLIGNGTFDKDSVAALYKDGSHVMLAGGEFVVTAQQARKHIALLTALNAGQDISKKMAAGGLTGPANDNNAAVVGVLRSIQSESGMRAEAAIYSQTAALVDELQMLRAEVATMRREAKQRSQRPDRLAS